MTTKAEKRLDAIDREVSQLKELLGTQKFRKDSIIKDLHTMVLNTDFLLYTIRSMGEGQQALVKQHEQQSKSLFSQVNLMDSFIKSKGLHNEFELYRKDMLEKQEQKRKEAEAKAKEEAEAKETEAGDGASGEPDTPGSEG